MKCDGAQANTNILFCVDGKKTFGGYTPGLPITHYKLYGSAESETFFNKTIDASHNNIIISLDQIAGGSGVAHLSGPETFTDKNMTSPTNNLIARGLWSGNGSTATLTYSSLPPTVGQVLTATSPTAAIWANPGASTSRPTYSLFNGLATATGIEWKTIAYFTWSMSRYGTYSNGVLIFYTKILGTNLDVRLFDSTNSVILCSDLNISTDGTRLVSVTNPTSDAVIQLQIRKSTDGGLPPEISGVTLEYN